MYGCRWSIGSGTTIKVMGDPWLRGSDAWTPSPQIQGVYNLNVSDLFIPNMKVWDKAKVESLFPLHVANNIVETPLINVIEEDKLIWRDSTNGNYSVKSGYKLLMEVTKNEANSSQHDDWLRLCKTQAPPKTKHLLSRICRGCLPSRVRLQEKHIQCQLSCPLCNHDFEEDRHVLFTCNVSVEARQAAGLDYVIMPRLQHFSSIKDLILDVCLKEPKETAGQFAVLAWVLWQNRNNQVWNNVQETGRCLGLKARCLWNEAQLVQHGPLPSTQQQQPLRWEKPQYGWYKCNIDAGFHKELNKTSTGWCLRDHMGRFVMA
ncbi:hypothetical protein QL285_031245 [Trifolium repens]|nr:hypothetical protein QL285_031245 [Trifolium repens]